jgi:hypothetical protein
MPFSFSTVESFHIGEQLAGLQAQGRAPDNYRRYRVSDREWRVRIFSGDSLLIEKLLRLDINGLIKLDAEMLRAGIELKTGSMN